MDCDCFSDCCFHQDEDYANGRCEFCESPVDASGRCEVCDPDPTVALPIEDMADVVALRLR